MSVKEQVRMLWATCFHDSEAFMDLYFGCRYADSLNEYMESDGQVIAALQRIPYRLTYEGMNVPVAYISGACTHPAYRERGSDAKIAGPGSSEHVSGRGAVFYFDTCRGLAERLLCPFGIYPLFST